MMTFQVQAVDLGYGDIKSMRMKDETYSVMPSLIARARATDSWDSGLGGDVNGFRLTWDGNDFYVGELAHLKSKHARGNQSRSRASGSEVLAYLYATLATHFPDGANAIFLATGLPIDWLNDSQTYKEEWPGDHRVLVNGREVCWRIVGVENGPQGYGAFVDQLFEWKGNYKLHAANKALASEPVFIADMGTLTFNGFRFESGVWQEELSGSEELGMRWAIERVSDALNTAHGVRFPDHHIDTVIRTGYAVIYGQPVNVKHVIAPILNDLAYEQAEYTKHLLGEGIGVIPHFYVAGGGAYGLYDDYVKFLGRPAERVFDPQGANVRGFLKWAVHLSRQRG
jgi:hypothetical protein